MKIKNKLKTSTLQYYSLFGSNLCPLKRTFNWVAYYNYRLRKDLTNLAWISQIIVSLRKALPWNPDHSSEFEGIPMCWNQSPPNDGVMPCQTAM